MNAAERTAAAVIIERMRAAIIAAGETCAAHPAEPHIRADQNRTLELHHALLAVVEVAMAGGLHPARALIAIRDIGVALWGAKLSVQFGADLSMAQLTPAAEEIAHTLFKAAGFDVAVSSQTTTHQPTTRH